MAEEKSTVVETPLMKQYNEIKAQYPDALLLFRVAIFMRPSVQTQLRLHAF